MCYQILEWDSAHFGFPIARLDRVLSEDEWGKFEDWCRKERVRCTYLLLPVSQIDSIQQAVKRGFEHQDIRVTLDLAITQARSVNDTRMLNESDLPKLIRMSSTVFKQSRFFSDNRFPPEKTARLYEIWVEKAAVPKPSQTVIVAGDVAAPSGFITCDIQASGEGHIGLFASFSEKSGLGQKLLAHASHWFFEKGVRKVSVATQGSAIAAQRSYQKAGFRTASTQMWLHRWA